MDLLDAMGVDREAFGNAGETWSGLCVECGDLAASRRYPQSPTRLIFGKFPNTCLKNSFASEHMPVFPSQLLNLPSS